MVWQSIRSGKGSMCGVTARSRVRVAKLALNSIKRLSVGRWYTRSLTISERLC